MPNIHRSKQSLDERLQAYPQLRELTERMIDEIENSEGHLDTADQAEDATVSRIRLMGKEMLTLWAQNKVRQTQPAPTPGLQRHAKKTPLVEHLGVD